MSESSQGRPQEKAPPLRRVLMTGTVWMVGLRWTIKLAGLVSTMILARLLTPEDFGLVAMCMAVVALAGVLFEFGTDYALINKANATTAHYDAAWSLRIIQGVLAAGLIAASAPFAAAYYADERVLNMLLTLSAGVFLRSFTNIGVVDFRKHLRFSREFLYLVSVKVITIPLTIGLALWLRNYWALVAGVLVSYVLEFLLSYLLHPLRPKFSLREGYDIWSFSKWMILFQIANYLILKMDRIVLGGIAGARQVGLYSLSGEIAHLSSAELVAPISRTLVPGFARLKGEPNRLDAAFLKSIAAVASIGVPAGVGVASVASEVIPLFLGTQWVEAVPLLRWLALHGALLALYSTSVNLLMVTDEMRVAALVSGARAVVFLGLMYPAFLWAGLLGVIYAKIVASAIGIVVLWVRITARRDVSIRNLIGCVWRPVLSAALMAWLLSQSGSWLESGTVTTLVVKVSLGVVTYGVLLIGLWMLFGSSSDIESDLLAILRSRISRFIRR